MFEPPDVICFPSPIRPPPTTLQYNPPLEISSLSIRGPALSFSIICSQHRLTYISSPKQSFGGVVGAGTPLVGDQSLLHTAAIIFIWMQISRQFHVCTIQNAQCTILPDESKSCALAWWLAWWQAYQDVEAQKLLCRMMEIKQIVHWSLITRQWYVCYAIHLQWNDLVLSIQASVMLLPQQLVGHKSGAADSRVSVYVS